MLYIPATPKGLRIPWVCFLLSTLRGSITPAVTKHTAVRLSKRTLQAHKYYMCPLFFFNTFTLSQSMKLTMSSITNQAHHCKADVCTQTLHVLFVLLSTLSQSIKLTMLLITHQVYHCKADQVNLVGTQTLHAPFILLSTVS